VTTSNSLPSSTFIRIERFTNMRTAGQTGLPIPYTLEPHRTVWRIFESNRLLAQNFRAQAERNQGPNTRARQCTVRIVYEPNRIDSGNAQFGTVRLGDVRLKVM
jgi:hypothetical protein